MVSKPTVLIVGAGGSAPFGFPSGKGLVELVLTDIELAEDPKGAPIDSVRSIRKVSKFEEILRENPGLLEKAKRFAEALRRSGSYSLDAFVETRREFLGECKLAIAATLIPLERDKVLFTAAKGDSAHTGDWYRYLSNLLHGNLGKGGKARLTILTYNYDRSIEHYLHTSLCNALGLDETRGHPELSGLEVIHLHGTLGALPWQENPDRGYSRAYSPVCDIEVAKKAAEQIKIIHENQDDTPEYALALERLHQAKRVCFVGFGFHRTNVRRLTKNEWHQGTEPLGDKVVRGSSHGLTRAERHQCEKLFGVLGERTRRELGRDHVIDLCHFGSDGLGFLRDNPDIIS